MKKSLITIGNSWGVILTKTMLEHMEINPTKDNIEITFQGKAILIKKAEDDKYNN